MDITLSFIGMVFIILSWIIQIYFTFKSGKKMFPVFAGFQFLGIVLLVFDSFQTLGDMGTMAWLNIGSAIGALIMLVLLVRK